MVDTTAKPDVVTEETGTLSLRKLIALDGLRGAKPNEVFGVDFQGDFNALPPHAKSYAGVGSALQGCPLDSWVRHGMHRNRRPEFSSFDQLTNGLSTEEKVRIVAILKQYLKDIAKRRPDFENRIFEGETLESAARWVHDMLRGIDDDTRTACGEFGMPGFEHQDNPSTTTEAETTPARTNIARRLQSWLRSILTT